MRARGVQDHAGHIRCTARYLDQRGDSQMVADHLGVSPLVYVWEARRIEPVGHRLEPGGFPCISQTAVVCIFVRMQ